MNHHLSTPVNDNTQIYYDASYQLNQVEPLELNQQHRQLLMTNTFTSPASNHLAPTNHFQASLVYDDVHPPQAYHQRRPNPVYDLYRANNSYPRHYNQEAEMQNGQHLYLAAPVDQLQAAPNQAQQQQHGFVSQEQAVYGQASQVFYEQPAYNHHYHQQATYSRNVNATLGAPEQIMQQVGQYHTKQSAASYYRPGQHLQAGAYQQQHHHHHQSYVNPQQSQQSLNCFASSAPASSSSRQRDPRQLALEEFPRPQPGIVRVLYQNGADEMDLHPTIKQQELAALAYEQQQVYSTQDAVEGAEQLIMAYGVADEGQQPEEAALCADRLLEQTLPEVAGVLVRRQRAATPAESSTCDVQQEEVEGEVERVSSGSLGPQECVAGTIAKQTTSYPTANQRRLSSDNVQQLVEPAPAATIETSEIKRQRQQPDNQHRDFTVDLKSSTSTNMPQDWLDNICHHLIDHLNRFGICVIDNFLGSAKGDLIFKEVEQLYSNGRYMKGRVVNNKIVTSRSLGNGDVSVIRNDRVIWVEGSEEGCLEINNLIATLCSVVTNSSRLSLYSNNGLDKIVINKRTKAHVACYPGNGTRYIKHVDNPNNDGRVITSIYYINKDWNTKRDGGLLRMFPAGMSEVANIEPLFDRVLFFWSDRRNPHEVLPAYKDRFAITVWYIGENRPKME